MSSYWMALQEAGPGRHTAHGLLVAASAATLLVASAVLLKSRCAQCCHLWCTSCLLPLSSVQYVLRRWWCCVGIKTLPTSRHTPMAHVPGPSLCLT